MEQMEVLRSGKCTNGTPRSIKDGKLLENQTTCGFLGRNLPRVSEDCEFILRISGHFRPVKISGHSVLGFSLPVVVILP